MQRYETVFILTPVLSEDQVKEAVAKFESILKDLKLKQGLHATVLYLYLLNMFARISYVELLCDKTYSESVEQIKQTSSNKCYINGRAR